MTRTACAVPRPSNVAEAPQVEAAPVQQSTPSVSYSQSSSGSASQGNSGSGSTAAAAPVSYQDLALGSKGAAVTRLQTRLSELDYYYEGINDYYDSLVNDAVALYQKAAGPGSDRFRRRRHAGKASSPPTRR